MNKEIKCLDKFKPLVTKSKRIKIIVGGRGSTKSTFIADRVACGMAMGELWACGREFQNSIDESVHRLLSEEVQRLELDGFDIRASDIIHNSGGRAFYLGLSRNILSLKGKLSGIRGLWIEEGEGLSEDTLRVGLPSVRLTALEYDQAKKGGYDPIEPEIWISMNRGSREDSISKLYLERAEPSLAKRGYYEDDECLIVQANYDDVPREWFLASGLETQRAADEKKCTPKQYRHRWYGEYLEAVENAIIQEEWFDSCVDAHEKLRFKAEGFECVTHDPSDEGDDSKGLCHRWGSVIVNVEEKEDGDANAGMGWALDYVNRVKADSFEWDGDGIGLGLKLQVSQSLGGKRIPYSMFRGGEAPRDPDSAYEVSESANESKTKTNSELFLNKRAQFYRVLADRMYNTHVAVRTGVRFNEEKLISFSSKIECLDKLRAELSRIPLEKDTNKQQIMRKDKMKSKYGIPSPNLADSVMMSMACRAVAAANDWGGDLEYSYEPIA